jgi:hypothetical protein
MTRPRGFCVALGQSVISTSTTTPSRSCQSFPLKIGVPRGLIADYAIRAPLPLTLVPEPMPASSRFSEGTEDLGFIPLRLRSLLNSVVRGLGISIPAES